MVIAFLCREEIHLNLSLWIKYDDVVPCRLLWLRCRLACGDVAATLMAPLNSSKNFIFPFQFMQLQFKLTLAIYVYILGVEMI
jgi:hypothetical protein